MGQAALSLSKNEEAANIKEYQFDMEAKGNVNYQAIWANPGHWTVLCVHMLLIV